MHIYAYPVVYLIVLPVFCGRYSVPAFRLIYSYRYGSHSANGIASANSVLNFHSLNGL